MKKIKIETRKKRIRIRIWNNSDNGDLISYTDIELVDYELELIEEE